MGILNGGLNGAFKWGIKCGFKVGICNGDLNGNFEWGL